MTNLVIRNGKPLNRSRSWGAFDEFENLVDRIFNNYYGYSDSETSMQMPIELMEKDNNFILKAVLPGLKKEDINIEVSEEQVNISGDYKSREEENSDNVYRSEFFAGKFERAISLPQKIDHQKAKADYKDGILKLTLPKSEKEINKTIKLSL